MEHFVTHSQYTKPGEAGCVQCIEILPASGSILGFPTEVDRFVLDTDASLLVVGGVLNQIQGDREVVITYVNRSLQQSQRRYCTTRREMLAAVTMCNHFRSYLCGAQFTICTNHRSLRWLQKLSNSDGMLVRWYLLLGHLRIPSGVSACQC